MPPSSLRGAGTALSFSWARFSASIALSVAPNPMRRADGRVSFTLPEAAHVSVRVLDVSGRLVEQLAHRTLAAGSHEVGLPPRLAAGVYTIVVSTAEARESVRVVNVR